MLSRVLTLFLAATFAHAGRPDVYSALDRINTILDKELSVLDPNPDSADSFDSRQRFRRAVGDANAACKSGGSDKPGTCGKPAECVGTTESGRCNGGNDNVCCLPAAPGGIGDPNAACKPGGSNKPGTCGKPADCAGTTESGRCNGGNDNVCCLPAAAASAAGAASSLSTTTASPSASSSTATATATAAPHEPEPPEDAAGAPSSNNAVGDAGADCKAGGSNKPGTCGKPSDCSGGGTTETGRCNGGSDNVCCVETDSSVDASSSSSSRPPPAGQSHELTADAWKTIWDKYPRGAADVIKKEIGGAVDAAWVSNTCVVRVSRSFNELAKSDEAKYKQWYVPRKFDLDAAAGDKKGLTIRGGDKKRYALRVAEFQHLVNRWLGTPSKMEPKTKVGLKEQQPGTEQEVYEKNYKETLAGKRGIVMFDTRGVWSDATGHFDVFDATTTTPAPGSGSDDGQRCGSHCYWKEAKEVWLWPVKD